jgi:S1-C subfamily serine protease
MKTRVSAHVIMAAQPHRGEHAIWLIPLAGAALTIGAALILPGSAPRHQAPAGSEGPAQVAGFTVAAMPPADGQLVVTSLQSKGQAERAGVRVGDRLEAVNRHRVRSARAADRYLKANARLGVELRIVRDHTVRTISLPQPAR